MNIKIILSEGKFEATIEIKDVQLIAPISDCPDYISFFLELATVADALASLKTT